MLNLNNAINFYTNVANRPPLPSRHESISLPAKVGNAARGIALNPSPGDLPDGPRTNPSVASLHTPLRPTLVLLLQLRSNVLLQRASVVATPSTLTASGAPFAVNPLSNTPMPVLRAQP